MVTTGAMPVSPSCHALVFLTRARSVGPGARAHLTAVTDPQTDEVRPPEVRLDLPGGRRTRELGRKPCTAAHGTFPTLWIVYPFPAAGGRFATGGARGLRPGMGLPVGGGQPLDRNVGVDLRARQRGMAEDLLHAAQVGTALQQVGGGGVPQPVWP
jgi:hypothetical protein